MFAPSSIPVRAGDRIKADRPDTPRRARRCVVETHETTRNLVRTRESAAEDLRHKRQLVSAFVLCHGWVYERTQPWTMRYRRWLQSLTYDRPAHQIAIQEMLSESNPERECQRSPSKPHRLSPSLELQPIKLARPWFPATACIPMESSICLSPPCPACGPTAQVSVQIGRKDRCDHNRARSTTTKRGRLNHRRCAS